MNLPNKNIHVCYFHFILFTHYKRLLHFTFVTTKCAIVRMNPPRIYRLYQQKNERMLQSYILRQKYFISSCESPFMCFKQFSLLCHCYFNKIPVGELYLYINNICFTFSSRCFSGENPKNSLSAERLDESEWR